MKKRTAGVVLLSLLVAVVGLGAFAQGTLVWGESNDHATLDPRISQSRHEVQTLLHIFDTLVFRTYEGDLLPYLATSWDVNADSTEYTFYLRDDVTFHDGTPFNAEAVKYTFDSIVDPELGSQAAVDYLGGENYAGTEVMDEFTVKVSFHGPAAAFLVRLSHPWTAIVSPTAARGRPDEFARAPVGTGPFMFKEWVQDDHVTVVKNPDYNWAPEIFDHQGPAYLDEIVFKEVQNMATRVAALEEGEVDLCDVTPATDMMRLESSGEYGTIVGNSPGIPLMNMFNLDDPVSADYYVRVAANYAIDQAALVEKFAFGYRIPAYGVLSPGTEGYWEGVEDYYQYNPELAKETLEIGGWEMGDDGFYYKDGQKCSIFLPIIYRETEQAIVQGELRKVGIELIVESASKPQQDEYVMSGFGNFAIRWGDPDGSVLRVIMHSSNISEPGLFKFNWYRIDSPTLDGLLAAAESAKTREERLEIFETIQRIERELALGIPLSPVSQTIAYRAGITGLKMDSRQHEVMFYDAKIEN